MLQLSSEKCAFINLANEPPFRLGALDVMPATRQVVRDGTTQTLEPRVMQVLVALARADGAVVGRDELVERCWDGRIVGENAINRVISRLRCLAVAVDGGFALETITKVGYRLVTRETEPAAPPPAAPPGPPAAVSVDRRLALGALAAAAVGVAGFSSWRALTGDARAAETARTLVARGQEALRQETEAQDVQAVAYFREASEIDPDSPEPWGWLALGYERLIGQTSDDKKQTVAAWSRSAARRALALDPDDGNARAALILAQPSLGRWRKIEADCRAALDERPDNRPLQGALAFLMCDVGRWRDAIPIYERLLSGDRFDPYAQITFAWALWSAGDLHRAQRTIEAASRLWPAHEPIWSARLCFLALTGRPDSALAFAADLDARPLVASRAPPPRFETSVAAAQALRTRSPTDAEAAVAAVLASRARGEVGTPYATMWLSTLGAADAAFDQLERYFFGSPFAGPGRKPAAPRWRHSMFLFVPPVAPLRADPRFAALMRRIGLEGYWRETGMQPDYRA